MPADRIIVPTFPRRRAEDVDRPARPQNSPSLQDVANIKHSAERGGVNRATAEDIAKVTAYRHAVLNAYVDPDQNDDIPVWARALEERLNEQFTALEGRFTALERRFIALEVMSTKTYNRSCSRGRRVPYMMVPSRDGIDPTGQENDPLPPLRTVEDIQNLTPAQLNGYMDFYHLHHVRRTTREVKLGLLRNHIGCIAEG
ncbi:hypothetical protein IW262DRAFT_1505655 [Armillaria fumosa]|nr:hypothetical protein IW262DRAFT_1505655 [Armillaria fumosa]